MKPAAKWMAAGTLVVGLIALNYLASAVPARLDLTAGKIYTLSAGTQALLEKLEEPVKLELYYSRSVEGVPISFKNYATRIEEMLRQYVRVSRGKLELRVIDPKPDTPEEERGTAAGLTPQPTPQGDTVYLGLVATQADQEKVIPLFTPQREPFLEYDLSQLVYQVQLLDKPRVGLLSGVPLKSPMDMQAMQMGRRPPPDQLVLSEWAKAFELVSVETSATSLPEDLDALAVIHPIGVTPALAFAIDQFVLSGKPALVAVDPMARHAPAGGPAFMAGGMGSSPNASSDLPELFKAWGLTYEAGRVVADTELATPVQMAPGRVGRLPSWLSLDHTTIDDSSLATNALKQLLFVDAGALGFAPGTSDAFTPLVTTTPEAGLVEGMALQFGDPEAASRNLTEKGTKTLAALVRGKFKTAFPDGAPSPEVSAPQDDASKSEPAPKAEFLKESTGATVLVVADTDWLFDDTSVRRMSFMGMEAAEPLNDNLAFASNALEFLAGSPDLISLRGKGTSLRPFTVVRRMEAEAQRQYQDQLEALESRMEEVQRKLTELQGKSGQGQRLVATPEMRKAIEDFEQQQTAMRAERRQIRAALREDIDALGKRLLALNLVVPPLLVGVFGLIFHWRRRRG